MWEKFNAECTADKASISFWSLSLSLLSVPFRILPLLHVALWLVAVTVPVTAPCSEAGPHPGLLVSAAAVSSTKVVFALAVLALPSSSTTTAVCNVLTSSMAALQWGTLLWPLAIYPWK